MTRRCCCCRQCRSAPAVCSARGARSTRATPPAPARSAVDDTSVAIAVVSIQDCVSMKRSFLVKLVHTADSVSAKLCLRLERQFASLHSMKRSDRVTEYRVPSTEYRVAASWKLKCEIGATPSLRHAPVHHHLHFHFHWTFDIRFRSSFIKSKAAQTPDSRPAQDDLRHTIRLCTGKRDFAANLTQNENKTGINCQNVPRSFVDLRGGGGSVGAGSSASSASLHAARRADIPVAFQAQ